MINLAGKPKEVCDFQCSEELQKAGIPLFPFKLLQNGEVKTDVLGMTASDQCAGTPVKKPVWKFTRAWRYWIAELHLPSGGQFNMQKAIKLHETHGKEVRVDGHCLAPAPNEWWGEDGIPCLYHIDTQEGLNAFAKAVLE